MNSLRLHGVIFPMWCRVVLLLCLLVPLAGQRLYAQVADRAVITGLVTDSSGAAVPGAKVTVTNEDTGTKTVVGTTGAGNYSTPPLILGTYTVRVEAPRFKAFTRSGIVLTGGMNYRQDAELQVGQLTQTMEVTGTSKMINTENATISHTLGQTYYKELPAVMGADIRLAEALLQLQPGYVINAPNGNAIFRGSQFQSRINGGQNMATENWFDGAAFGYAEGHQQTHESAVPYDSVKEMTVVENTFSAQYGHTSGGFVVYTTKSGTEHFHGNAYDFLGSSKLDARNFFLREIPPLTQDNWGFTVGGPVLIKVPKIYSGSAKTFFFVNVDGLDMHTTVNTGFVNTIPIPAFRQGDFSRLLDTSKVIGQDALRRPIFQGEIFNPATTRTVSGIPVRDGYGFDSVTGAPIAGAANIIPANDPLRSQITAKLVPLFPALDRDTLQFNGFGTTSDDNNKLNARTYLTRIDHSFNERISISNTYYWNNRPRLSRCGRPGGCNTLFDGIKTPEKNDTYIGQGFFQRITNHFDHFQLNWVIKPNLFNHTTLAYDRWVMEGHSLSAKVGWLSKLGIKGLLDNTAGPPALGFSGVIPYSPYGTPWFTDGKDINNRYQFLDDLTWIVGRHTVKGGVEYRYMQFPQAGWAINTGGFFNFSRNETGGIDAKGNILTQTGDPFASFLLGQVDNAGFTIPSFVRPTQKYLAPWVNDDIKLTSKLTLSFGVRADWLTGLYEKFDRISSFSPTTPNPAAGGIPGAMVFAGNGPGRAGRRSFANSNWNVDPRFGLAYQIDDKDVIRAGYGMYFAGVPAGLFNPYPLDGFQTNPLAPNLTNGLFPAFFWDDGFPAQNVIRPPIIDPSVTNGGSPIGDLPDGFNMPRYQNWTLSVQRQLSGNMAIDVAYVGNHGTRLIAGSTFAGLAANVNDPSVLALGTALLQADINSPQAQAAGILPPFPGFKGNVAQALRPFPQYQRVRYRNVPVGTSHYNALQVAFNRRLTNGFQARLAYTWSKLINNGADAGQGGGGTPIQNPVNIGRGERALSQDDVRHILALAWIYQLPFGPGKRFGSGTHGALAKMMQGWRLSATQTYQSGRPLAIFMDNNLGGLLFNGGKRPNKVGPGKAEFHDPATDRFLLASGFADPGPLTFGNESRRDPDLRGFPFFNEDLSISKDTYINETTYVRFESQFGNLFNRVDFCPPETNFSNTRGFGTVSAQCNTPRRIQFGLQIFF